MIRVLTVRQPWAWAIVHGGKDVENRTRNVAGSYRGPLAIQAGLTGAAFDPEHPELWPFDDRHDFGAIIGVVDLVEIHHADWCWDDLGDGGRFCSVWGDEDVHHLVLANSRPLPAPIPFKGALHLQTAPEGVEAEIVRQIGPIGG